MGRNNLLPRPGGYTLEFGDGSISVDLDAWDRASAFATAQRLVKEGRPATLLEHGVAIASLSYSPEGFWTVTDTTSAAA